eukprot:CAMPEP_0183303074 /NCGR_PEP_ID=MMETSP0160_2-20130417/8649_1 /TAXON_ID=2839 ORGANISM="Odontella Sinensis, Strain Grunow 1884" /NCGR_SAMPLE_ID=MMETSP0160_2 /ASSEMBLY_ACC=CAM_ASM_000250 /LENGTH=58 /DNA_ID=CAMNT_0025465931 /DNA_START=60 /DNA_END=233 /DNA_ORIENTATION=+
MDLIPGLIPSGPVFLDGENVVCGYETNGQNMDLYEDETETLLRESPGGAAKVAIPLPC